ncbi:hypothetical protein CBL_08391 [Carabus blaptoides fortunei]
MSNPTTNTPVTTLNLTAENDPWDLTPTVYVAGYVASKILTKTSTTDCDICKRQLVPTGTLPGHSFIDDMEMTKDKLTRPNTNFAQIELEKHSSKNEHENSDEHRSALTTLLPRKNADGRVDRNLFLQTEEEIKYWHEIKHAKYFSISVDSTPDISHVDQLSFIVRYVSENGCPVERFLKFIPNCGHKAEDLVKVVLETLKNHDFYIADCWGKSYDKASNMPGVNSSLQARINSEPTDRFRSLFGSLTESESRADAC